MIKLEWEFFIKLWWAHVIVTPELNKIAVFKRGIEKGLIIEIPTGGQIAPNSREGAKELWKKAQKKAKKKQTSEVINKIIPHRNPSKTLGPWKPCARDSIITFFHQKIITINIIIKPSKRRDRLELWNQFTKPIVIIKELEAPIIGQGLNSTKWKGE